MTYGRNVCASVQTCAGLTSKPPRNIVGLRSSGGRKVIYSRNKTGEKNLSVYERNVRWSRLRVQWDTTTGEFNSIGDGAAVVGGEVEEGAEALGSAS